MTNDVTDLLEVAMGYRQKIPEVLSYTSPELVEQEMLKIEEFRNTIQERDGQLADEIDVLRAKRRSLALADEFAGTDIKKLKSYFWSLKNAEKDNRYRS